MLDSPLDVSKGQPRLWINERKFIAIDQLNIAIAQVFALDRIEYLKSIIGGGQRYFGIRGIT